MSTRIRLLALGILLSVGVTGFVGAAESEQSSAASTALADIEDRRKRLAEAIPNNVKSITSPSLEQADTSADLAFPASPPVTAGETTRTHFAATLKSYYDYRQAGYDHRLRVFKWQHVSTIIIFFIVIGLVITGVYFAAIQFHRGKSPDTTEVELSVKGVKVRSPVLGVIILTLSLGFFYLYLAYVYPIQNAF